MPPPQVKKYFLYTGSVVRVSASLSFIAVSHLNPPASPLGLPKSDIFSLYVFKVSVCILCLPSGECF